MNNNVIEIQFHLPIHIVKKEKWYVASCPVLDVYSQGEMQEIAKANLTEALTLFFHSCIERGTLDAVLKECGLTSPSNQLRPEGEFINIPIQLMTTSDHAQPCLA